LGKAIATTETTTATGSQASSKSSKGRGCSAMIFWVRRRPSRDEAEALQSFGFEVLVLNPGN